MKINTDEAKVAGWSPKPMTSRFDFYHPCKKKIELL